MTSLWLNPIPLGLREKACQKLETADISGFLLAASNEHGLHLVFHNQHLLAERGLYEKALLDAYIGTRTNNRNWGAAYLESLFAFANRDRMLAAGDPLPGRGPFTLYRGVAGRGRTRRVRGYSWTASIEDAQWFAGRFGLPDPAVFCTVAEARDVYAYIDDREEKEFLFFPQRHLEVTRVWPTKGG